MSSPLSARPQPSSPHDETLAGRSSRPRGLRGPLLRIRWVTGDRLALVVTGALIAAFVIAGLAAALLVPGLQAGARTHAESNAQGRQGNAAQYVEAPSFTIAVGMDDEPREMPAIQSAMTDFLAFSDQFADRLEQGAVAPDFATHEHTMPPEAARQQVADGTSVLAVVLPADLTPAFFDELDEYANGLRGEPPAVTITLVAGPQARAQDDFILDQYRTQVVNQAAELIAEQMRVTSGKLGTQVDQPVEIDVEDSDGPPAQDYLYESQIQGAPEDGAAQSGTPAPDDGAEYANAGDQARSDDVAERADFAFLTYIPTMILGAFGAGALAAAVATSALVDRASGLGVTMVGPWRRQAVQRPVPRTLKLGAKAGISAVVVAVLSAATVVAFLLNAHTNPTYGSERNALPTTGSEAVVGTLASFSLLLAVGLAAAFFVIAVAEVAGSLASWLATTAALGWFATRSDVLFHMGLAEMPAMSSLAKAPDILQEYSFTRAVLMFDIGPGILSAAAVCALCLLGARLVTRLYDRTVTTRPRHV